MCKFSRREFLVSSACGALAVQTNQAWAANVPADKADMAIARWNGPQPRGPQDTELDTIAAKLARQAIDGLGGMSRFVKRGDKIWIKPNIGWDRTPEQAGNTNPYVVAEIVKMCLDAGAKTVKVGDNSCHSAVKTYAASGIAAAVKPLGAEVVYLNRDRYKETAVRGERVKTLMLYPDIIDADLVINIPIVKHHVLANATLGMKNYMGVMDNRAPFHQDFATCLSDITRFMKPRLSVLDAVRILTAHGPTGGKLEDVAVKTIVAASTDIVAMDSLGLEIFGKPAAETRKARSIIKYAAQVGLGKANYKDLAVKEFAVT
jgi:uncharacterized protein (DUF362 family)